MAMTQKERDQRRKEKDAKRGAEEMRIKTMAGEKKMVLELMDCLEDKEQASMILTSVRYMHSMGRDGVREAMKAFRALHKVRLTEDVERRFMAQSMLMIQQDPGDEIVPPTVG